MRRVFGSVRLDANGTSGASFHIVERKDNAFNGYVTQAVDGKYYARDLPASSAKELRDIANALDYLNGRKT